MIHGFGVPDALQARGGTGVGVTRRCQANSEQSASRDSRVSCHSLVFRSQLHFIIRIDDKTHLIAGLLESAQQQIRRTSRSPCTKQKLCVPVSLTEFKYLGGVAKHFHWFRMAKMIIQRESIEYRQQLSHVAEREAKLVSALKGFADLLAPGTSMVDKRAPQRHLQRQLSLLRFHRFWKMLKLPKALVQLTDHFGEGEAAGSPPGGFQVVVDCLVRRAGVGEVPGEQLGFGCRWTGCVLLEHLGDAQVEFAALIAHQRGVGGILHKSVLERVSCFRRPAARKEETGLHQFAERLL